MQRRHFIAGLTAMSAVPITLNLAHAQQAIAPMSDPDVLLYAGIHGEAFEIPPVDVRLIRPGYRRQLTDYTTTERPGTIVVDTVHRYLYLVAEGARRNSAQAGVAHLDPTDRNDRAATRT